MVTANIKIKKRIVYISYAVLLLLIYVFEYSSNVASPVGKGSVSVLLPAVLVSGIMFKEWAGAFYGLGVGIAIDSVASNSYIFNTIALFVLCCVLGLLIKRIFINNTLSAIILLVAGIFTYYFLQWLVCHLMGGNPEASAYLTVISLPSAIYTSLVGIPMYFVIRTVYRKIVNK